MSLKKKKGFTLIEIIIALAVLSIVMVSISQIVSSILNLNTAANDNYTAQTDAQLIMQRIQREIEFASSINIDGSMPESFKTGTNYIYVSDGKVMKNSGVTDGSAFPIAYISQGFSCGLNFKKSSSKSVEVTVTIYKRSKELYKLETVIYINNLISTDVAGTGEGSAIEYTFPD